ncbi:Nucleotide-sugar transporter [Phytophthora cactorum]|nr:Nucleotide-sugar transporter [Phytophthora cactorum]
MELGRMLALMLVAAAFLCSGNLCIIASKVDGLVPYSSVTVTFLIEVFKLSAMLAAIVVTDTTIPDHLQLQKSFYYAVPALLNALESNLNYVVLRYLDAATVSVLWNLKILLTAVLFRYVLKHPLSELHKMAIVLLILGVLTSQSDRRLTECGAGLSLALVGVTLSSCASVFAEWTLKRQSDCRSCGKVCRCMASATGTGGWESVAIGRIISWLQWLDGGRSRRELHWRHLHGLHPQVFGQHCVCVLALDGDDVHDAIVHDLLRLLAVPGVCLWPWNTRHLHVSVPPSTSASCDREGNFSSSDTSSENDESLADIATSLQLKKLNEYKEVQSGTRDQYGSPESSCNNAAEA